MIDEHFMRQWSDGHQRFSSGIDEGLARLRRIIDAAYAQRAADGDASAPVSKARQSLLAGLAATALTVILLSSTVALATPGAILA